MTLRVEHVDDLGAIREEWSELAERCGNVSGSWEWCQLWARHIARGRRLMVRACRDSSGRLVALLPLYLASRAPVRTLRFMGHGPICRAEDMVEAVIALREVLERSRGWDLFVADLPGDQPWGTLAAGTPIRRLASPVLRADGLDWDGYLRSRSRNFRDQVRRRERKLAREHDLRYRLTEDERTLEDDMRVLFELHDARWGSEGASYFTGLQRSFHEELAALALRDGWLRLWFLELDGRPAAAWYGFRFARREWYFQAGRDPALEQHSVGLVLLVHTIRAALEDGVCEYRFGRGGEEYKKRFANEARELQTVAVPGSALGSAALKGLLATDVVRPWTRQRIERAQARVGRARERAEPLLARSH